MNQNSQHFPNRVLHLWTRLTEPPDGLSLAEKRLSRLLMSLLITLILLAFIYESLYVALTSDLSGAAISVITALLLMAAFGLCKMGRLKFSAAFTIAIASAGIFAIVLASAGTLSDVNMLLLLVIPLLISNIFFSNRQVLLIVIFYSVGMLSLPIVVPAIELSLILIGPAPFLWITALIIFILNHHRDQAEHERQAALSASEERFRQLAENIKEAFLMYDLSTEQVLYASPAYEQVTGKSSASLFKNSASLFELIHPDDTAQMFALIQGTKNGQQVSMESRILHQDGSFHWIWIRSFPIFDVHGNVIRLAGLISDITESKNTALALQESHEKYRGLLETLDSAITTIDGDGRFLYLNEIAARQLGGTPEQLTGKTMTELFPEPVATQQLQNIQRVITTDQPCVVQNETILQGEHYWHRASIQPIHDASGRAVRALLNSTDVTELVKAQRQLEELNHTLELRVEERTAQVQDLYDNAPCGYHSIDKEGNFVMINQTELNWLGYSRSEIIGVKNVRDLLTADSQQVFAENFPRFLNQGWIKDLEMEFMRKDGSILPVFLSGSAVLDASGTFVMTRSTLFDITQRKKAEEALRASEENYRKAITAADAVPYRLDYASNEYIFMGEGIEKITGYRREEMTPMLFESIIQESTMRGELDHLPTDEAVDQVRSGQETALRSTWRSDIRILCKDGQNRWLLDNSIQLLDENGKPVGSIGILQDITERRKAEVELSNREKDLRAANIALAKAAKLKDEFLASMSHELRTPLTGILGLADALQENIYGQLNEKQASRLKMIEESGHHLLNLINDILDLSKVEASKMQLELTDVPLADLCQASLRMTKQMAAKKHQSVSFSLTPHDLVLNCDQRRVKQILVNLLSNAIKFTPENGELGLDVRTDKERQEVYFCVWDKGIGIALDDLENLFRPFVQLDSSLSRSQTGTGLGLSLVQGFTELHGGRIEVETEPGQGSRFTVVIPISIPPQNEVEEQYPAINKTNLPITSALIIDDSSIAAEYLNVKLNELGINQVMNYDRATGALEYARKTQPTVVLLDILLPDGDGWDLLRQFKADPELGNIPVIVVSVVDDRIRSIQLGAVEHLLKPISFHNLQKALSMASHQSPKHVHTAEVIAASQPTRRTILMAEDNPVNEMIVSEYLEKHDYDVITVSNGKDVIEKAVTMCPDLILMDIQMPDIDGLEATRRIRHQTNQKVASIPIVAITAMAMAGDRERCLAAGVNRYMSKPLVLKELISIIQDLLENRELMQ